MELSSTIGPRIRDAFSRHRWLFLLTLVVVTGITGAFLLLRARTFKATAYTQVIADNQEVADALGEQYRFAFINSAQQNANQFTDLFNDDRPGGFVATALKAADLRNPISVDPRDNDARYAKLRKGLFANVESPSLFSINLTWDNASECERIINAFQKQYIESAGQSKTAKSVATQTFLDTEIKKVEKRMRAAEQALIEYKQKNSGQLPEAQTADIEHLAALRMQRDTLVIASQDAGLQESALRQRIAQITPMTVYEQTVTDGPNASILKQLMTRRAALLSQGYLPTSEEVTRIDENIARLKASTDTDPSSKSATDKNVTQARMRSNPEYQELTAQLTKASITKQTQSAQISQANQKIAEYEARIARIPAAQRELADKTRDYTILKALYENLSDKREQARLKANLDRATALSTLIKVGTVYATPTATKTKQAIMLIGSLFLGLVVGGIVVVLSEWTDPTIRYAADAERLLELPVLAAVPETKEFRLAAAPTGSASLSRITGSHVADDAAQYGKLPQP